MRVYLLDASKVTDEQIEKLAQTLPPFRAATAKRCRRPEAYRTCVLGFCLVRHAVKCIAPDADTEHWGYNGCGKPHIGGAAPCFNLSHAGDVIAVGVADCELGVDVEKITPRTKGFAARFLSEQEQAAVASAAHPDSELTRIWSAKEARVKRDGCGIGSVELRDIPTNGVRNTHFSQNGAGYWLSLCPADEALDLTWVDIRELH